MTWEEAISSYSSREALHLSDNTVRTYATNVHMLARYAGSTPEELTCTTVEKFLAKRRNDLQPASYCVQVQALRKFVDWLYEGNTAVAPLLTMLQKIRLPKVGRVPRALTPADASRLIETSDWTKNWRGVRNRCLMTMFLYSGLRVSELLSLTVSDALSALERADATRPDLVILGKGNRERDVYLNDVAKSALRRYLEVRPNVKAALFVSGKRGMTVRRAQMVVKEAAERAGIALSVTPHTLRHTFGTEILRAKRNLRLVQDLLGHANVRTTQIYTHVTSDERREATSALDYTSPGE